MGPKIEAACRFVESTGGTAAIDPDEAAPYRLALRPWVTGTKDQVIAIHADMVTGFRLAPATTATASPVARTAPAGGSLA
jgi:hypothetical protein